MGKRLEGKTVLITGASSGIGRSTAKMFASASPQDLKLIISARRIENLQQLTEEIRTEFGEGVKILPVKLDVSKAADISDLVRNLPDEFRDIDILVNNALVFLETFVHDPSL
jgi:3-hydroxy acid dehydrogenase/malonic semialdehyde reductase